MRGERDRDLYLDFLDLEDPEEYFFFDLESVGDGEWDLPLDRERDSYSIIFRTLPLECPEAGLSSLLSRVST